MDLSTRQGRSQWLYEFLILAALILYPRQLSGLNTDFGGQIFLPLAPDSVLCASIQGLPLVSGDVPCRPLDAAILLHGY
ncbi:hypothetical protein IQ254_03840 [Nodosilinea sp. LEGE 07088]|uniref:hypothetical protein n=1 Tax=Nodosilinea sp. LEGE 07088 TaxID=2777968 RepID=UPI001881386D|nr:hypothetical protein [Nodosilinea sp. LEGE 07088]MBE9136342.1 hypothetical protein [Nodosilinea sp. LEGE 07088]